MGRPVGKPTIDLHTTIDQALWNEAVRVLSGGGTTLPHGAVRRVIEASLLRLIREAKQGTPNE